MAEDDDRSQESARNHLRAWREFRQLSQTQLADRIGTNASVISLLETGNRALSYKWLLKIAAALSTRPGFLLDFEPEELDVRMLDEMMELTPAGKAQAIEMMRILRRG